MIKPYHTLLFLLAVAALSTALMWVAPAGGWQLGAASLRYPSWEEFWTSDTARVVDVDALLRTGHRRPKDTSNTEVLSAEELRAQEKLERTLALRELQFPDGDTLRLSAWLESLKSTANGGRVRVLHFGDSQIEGDRITSYLREQWQAEYGGEGPGMLPAMPLTPNFSIRQEQSANWKRYPAFGRRDSNVTHSKYGYRAVMSRYTSPILDSSHSDTTQAWIEFKPSVQGYRHVRTYHRMRMYFGGHRQPLRLTVYANDTLLTEEIVPVSGDVLSRTWRFSQTPETLRLEFQGGDSPDVYGISLEGRSGIVVDNIAMRGASGVVFTRIDQSNLSAMLRAEPVSLVLLQYGGNTVPYIRDEEHAKQYARRFQRQIRRLKALIPEASFVVIGPSDMSQRDGTSFRTYDAVPWVRDALREVAFAEGVAFWDIYGAMGGFNAMPEWVKAEPPLAGADHIHFTPSGARQVATWLHEAFENAMQPDTVMVPSSNPATP